MTFVDESHTFIASFYVGYILCPAVFILASTISLVYFLYWYLPAASNYAIRCSNEGWDCVTSNVVLWTNMFCYIGERVRGIWYLVEGPSSLHSGYTRVSFVFLQTIDIGLLIPFQGSRKLVQDSDSIEQPPHGDF